MRHLGLLRGINVGGNNLLPMKDLAALFTEAGCKDVATYIQSGNVVFTAEPALAAKLPALVAAGILASHGIKAPVLVRSADELRAVLLGNPYPGDEAMLHVMFLADRPDPAKVAALDPAVSPGDSYTVAGREIYLRLPNGVARTKLTNAWFDARLATVSTGRNWRTVAKLCELVEGRV
jgi:uncharacterized protein (DUF1697 family)